MAIYDMARAIQGPNADGLAQGLRVGQQMAERRRADTARNALARLAQGDQTALPELMQADPDAGMKWQDAQRAEETRTGLQGFFKPARADLVMPAGSPVDNALDMLAGKGPGMVPQIKQTTPASFDAMGATNFLASRGDANALELLLKAQSPDSAEFGLNPQVGINPQTGKPEFFVTNKQGKPNFLGIGDKPQAPKVSGGWIMGDDGTPVAPLPMTPAQVAADSRAEEAARRADRQAEIALAGLDLSQEKTRREMDEKTAAKQQDRELKYKSVNDLDSTLAAYKTALQTASRGDLLNPVSDKAVELRNLATQLQMAYKNAADLGAITGPDWAIINSVVATPSGAKAALLGPEKLLKQLEQVEALSKRQRAELDRVYGGNKPMGDKPQGKSGAYQEYLDAFNRATTSEQRRAITARARQMGVVK